MFLLRDEQHITRLREEMGRVCEAVAPESRLEETEPGIHRLLKMTNESFRFGGVSEGHNLPGIVVVY